VALETRARPDGDRYVLDGAKRRIGDVSFTDFVIVWARRCWQGRPHRSKDRTGLGKSDG